MFGEDLDGDGAIEAGVAGRIDLAHPTLATRGYNLVRAERRAELKRH